MKFLNNAWEEFINMPFFKYIILCLLIIVILDIIMVFNSYYLNIYYEKISNYLDKKRLSYLRKTVISGYRILASEEVINKSIEKVRNLEEELGEEAYDFTHYYEQYKIDIKNVHDRGYY